MRSAATALALATALVLLASVGGACAACSDHNQNCGACVAVSSCGYCDLTGVCMDRSNGTPASCSVGAGTHFNVGTCSDECSNLNSCGDCTGDTSCVWCQTQNFCAKGTPIGPASDYVCDDWKWKQCAINGALVAGLVGGGAGLLILIIVIACCICRRRRRRRRIQREHLLMTREEESYYQPRTVEEYAPRTTAKRRELEEKYGVRFSSRQ